MSVSASVTSRRARQRAILLLLLLVAVIVAVLVGGHALLSRPTSYQPPTAQLVCGKEQSDSQQAGTLTAVFLQQHPECARYQ